MSAGLERSQFDCFRVRVVRNGARDEAPEGSNVMDANSQIPRVDASPASETGSDPIADQLKRVSAAASSLLDKAQETQNLTDRAAAVEKAASALREASEISKTTKELEKLAQEILRLRRDNELATRTARSERMRDYVALLTPLVTIITLAATLIVQNWQFVRSERDKQQDQIDARWQDAVKAISASGALSPGVIALQPFLRSEKYGEPARDVAVNLLSNSSDPAFFTSLFGPALTPVVSANLDRVVRLDRALRSRGDPVFSKAFDETTKKADMNRLSKEEGATFAYVEYVAPVITSEIAGVLRTRSPGTPIDLSGAYLYDADLQKLKLGGVNLENAEITGCDLRDAELEGITQFSGASFYETAWWEAKSIDRPLLDYLLANDKLSPELRYGTSVAGVTPEEYDRAVQRLQSQLK